MSNDFRIIFFFDNLFSGDEMKDDKLKEIILENQNLIYSIIHKFRSKDYDDLYQAGCIGLINAYNNFNSSSNVKFSSYAYNYILGEIYKYLINNRVIHVSPLNAKLIISVTKAEDYLTNHLGRNPTIDEICAFLEIDESKLWDIRRMMSIESLDYEYSNSDLYDFVCSNDISKDDFIDLKDALNSLSLEERRIINARYYNNYTQGELAKIYHTNQVKVSREEKKILTKLKAKMH